MQSSRFNYLCETYCSFFFFPGRTKRVCDHIVKVEPVLGERKKKKKSKKLTRALEESAMGAKPLLGTQKLTKSKSMINLRDQMQLVPDSFETMLDSDEKFPQEILSIEKQRPDVLTATIGRFVLSFVR